MKSEGKVSKLIKATGRRGRTFLELWQNRNEQRDILQIKQ